MSVFCVNVGVVFAFAEGVCAYAGECVQMLGSLCKCWGVYANAGECVQMLGVCVFAGECVHLLGECVRNRCVQ